MYTKRDKLTLPFDPATHGTGQKPYCIKVGLIKEDKETLSYVS